MVNPTLSFLVITKVWPYGDIREPGWSLQGERSKCSLHHKHRYWHGATQESLAAMMPTAYLTKTVYNKLKDLGEIEGIRSKIVGVVEDDWRVEVPNPYYGGGTCWALDLDKVIPCLPEPHINCRVTGSFTEVPDFISILVVGTTPTPAYKSLPVTLSLMESCLYDGVATSPLDLIGKFPVTLSIDDVDIGTFYPTSQDPITFKNLITFDLYSYIDVWTPLLTPATREFKIKARFARQTMHNMTLGGTPVPDACFEQFSAETTIPVVFGECLNETKRYPTTCWDGTIVYAEICRDNEWVPTGETCPPMPADGEGRNPTTCWDGTIIYAEKFDAATMTWVPTGDTCPPMPADGELRGETTCWDGTVIHAEKFDATLKKWVPTGETCPPMPGPGEGRNPTTCWDGTIIYAEKFDDATKTWVPTGATCPPMPGPGEGRNPTTCWDGTIIYAEKFDTTLKKWVPTGATCPVKVCTEGEKRNPIICWDGTVIQTEICRDNAWVPSGEVCPTTLPERVIRLAVPKIVYEGQAVDIIAQVYCGSALSTGEPATLTVDGVDVQTKSTSAGEVKFRWTAKGTGIRKVCVYIPENLKCPVAGSECETITISAYVGDIREQIKSEKAAYEEELARLRELRKLERKPSGVSAPGVVMIPPSLAGTVVEVGGIPTTIPSGGLPIVVPPGETIVTVIKEGIKNDIPVVVLPGETITLPTPPGGL